MKIRPNPSQSGSTLLITVITGALLGTVLCSYLVLVVHRNTTAMRATAWNSAMPILEAGIEEALTHLYEDAKKPTANDWAAQLLDGGRTCYWKRRDFADGSYFAVTNFDIISHTPTIVSGGYVKSPLKENEYISRIVRVTATNPPSAFSRAIAAEGAIKLSGSATVDGFDSSGYPSALVAYNDSTNRSASGGIATNSKELKAIDVGSGHVYGTAVTGPGGTVAVAGGTVGDFQWSSTHTGIQPGWVDDDMNVFFEPISPPNPNATWLPPERWTVGASNITVLKTGTYQATSFTSLDLTKPMMVIGHAELWVKQDFVVSGAAATGGYVYIAPGASLKLYVGGRASISGGGIVNGTGLPNSFSYYGLQSSKLFNYSGAANFIGTINAPNSDVTLSGGAALYGAVICKTMTCSGGSSVHYDKALSSTSPFLLTSWREL